MLPTAIIPYITTALCPFTKDNVLHAIPIIPSWWGMRVRPGIWISISQKKKQAQKREVIRPWLGFQAQTCPCPYNAQPHKSPGTVKRPEPHVWAHGELSVQGAVSGPQGVEPILWNWELSEAFASNAGPVPICVTTDQPNLKFHFPWNEL